MSFTCISAQTEPNKSPLRKRLSWPFSFERWATFPPQADHVLVDLFSSVAAGGQEALPAEPPPNTQLIKGFDNVKYNRQQEKEKEV